MVFLQNLLTHKSFALARVLGLGSRLHELLIALNHCRCTGA